ncbi:PREDICTED: uncharacterized protein LOC109467752 [Branchiostoma belcheri]|uniref:Uncharacterized protein LOC109467752 n=1 Tax=Branchiostoma belcheri TaxID=7741 RepID=A0A6P4YVT6_BRABE|nr:PREDICTED: uncharacterized protein LOC109467752 [Branchiostoma belcheri]
MESEEKLFTLYLLFLIWLHVSARHPCAEDEKLEGGECRPCPVCLDGQQLSTVCGYGAGAGAECVSCPPDHYSNTDSNHRCTPCTNCTALNAEYRQLCSPGTAAVCGTCLPGHAETFKHCHPCAVIPNNLNCRQWLADQMAQKTTPPPGSEANDKNKSVVIPVVSSGVVFVLCVGGVIVFIIIAKKWKCSSCKSTKRKNRAPASSAPEEHTLLPLERPKQPSIPDQPTPYTDDPSVTSNSANGHIASLSHGDDSNNSLADRTLTNRNITPGHVANGNIPSAHMANGNLPSAPMANGNLPSTHMANGNLPSAPMANGNLPSTHMANGNLPSTHMANGNLPSAPMANGNLPSTHMANGNLPSAHMANGNLPSTHMANGNLPSAPMANGNIPSAPMANGNLPSTHMANGNLPSAPMANGNIPSAPMANGAVTRKFPIRTHPGQTQIGDTLPKSEAPSEVAEMVETENLQGAEPYTSLSPVRTSQQSEVSVAPNPSPLTSVSSSPMVTATPGNRQHSSSPVLANHGIPAFPNMPYGLQNYHSGETWPIRDQEMPERPPYEGASFLPTSAQNIASWSLLQGGTSSRAPPDDTINPSPSLTGTVSDSSDMEDLYHSHPSATDFSSVNMQDVSPKSLLREWSTGPLPEADGALSTDSDQSEEDEPRRTVRRLLDGDSFLSNIGGDRFDRGRELSIDQSREASGQDTSPGGTQRDDGRNRAAGALAVNRPEPQQSNRQMIIDELKELMDKASKLTTGVTVGDLDHNIWEALALFLNPEPNSPGVKTLRHFAREFQIEETSSGTVMGSLMY